MQLFRLIPVCLLAFLPAGGAVAQTGHNFDLTVDVDGHAVTVPAIATVIPADAALRAAVQFQMDLAPLVVAVNALADRELTGDLSHRGTALWSGGGNLGVKVHLRYRPCFNTNGSVTSRVPPGRTGRGNRAGGRIG